MTESEPIERTAGRHEFRTLGSEDLYQGAVMALRADDIEMPGGVTGRREVVEHPGAVAIVAIDDEGRVVLIHQYRHPLGRRLWELPAGLLDLAGEPPVETARRELAEEVSLSASQWSVLADVAASPGFTDEVVRVFLATDLHEVETMAAEGNEEADLVVHRVPLDEAVRMVVAGEIVNASTATGLLAARAVLTGLAEARDVDAPWSDRPMRWAARKAGRD
ncbi:NUDIX domain-containing protein [Actinoalloteichus hymeniacidonis]|uniref:NTP pyrophosphohydrolase n=1 Tax=Actinoalloteichus hymeniacidonis TaxID=340345 RepID=A0AAC9HS45_9PSEU|nr:NUDIX hydrolase [Actinoalloteichus hymeniacidonis]AOS64403.1 NTP pyrophosphohydrolase [Actinoalloteichus hymeniacidonis]MBB5907529.1 ADP-ribose pyrophosphatase [Actinoalloteichus hymeniacidonis]